MDNYFNVTPEHIASLSANEAVARFRELLWADTLRLGIPLTIIHVSDLINVPDGGIDAAVDETGIREVAGFNGALKPGRTGYQLKTGRSFEPWTASGIKNELFGDKEPSRENLAEGVRYVLDADGTYVLVCFGHDLVDSHHRSSLDHIRSYLEHCGYKDPKVEVWSQNNLLGLFHLYPSLSLRVSGRDRGPFWSHHSWSLNEDMRKEFRAGEQQNQFISSMQDGLRRTEEAVHIRVLGEPGIGKTKLVLEATRAVDLHTHVLYCPTPSAFLDNPLMSSILAEDNHYSAILIIDECDPQSARGLWNVLKNRGPRIKLITIFNDFDDTYHEVVLDAPPLETDQLTKIIASYDIPEDQAYNFVEFCSGSPRVAHILGENLRHNREDLLRPTSTVPNLWDRYIAGPDDPASQVVQERKRVLQHISLFKRFGYASQFADDAHAIVTLIREVDPQMTQGRFQEIVTRLKARKILQGENILYITPKALHVKLWLDWWNIYGTNFDLTDFSSKLTPQLNDWLQDMFRYAHGSEAARRVVKKLLGPDGPFRANDLLKSDKGAHFFQSLAEADPESAILCLKPFIERLSKDELVKTRGGRRDIVRTLEKVAMWETLFADAARLLLKLGEAENESWSNNASGIFADLFSLGYGPLAPTEAPPAIRFPVLVEAFRSGSKEQQLLAIKAVNQALETRHFRRTVGAERQGLKKGPELWIPATYGELHAAYRQVWLILRDNLSILVDDNVRRAAAEVLLGRAYEIVEVPDFADTVIETIRKIAQEPWIDKEVIISAVARLLRYKMREMPTEERSKWEALRDELSGSDFGSLLRRYVGMNVPGDYYDDEGNFVTSTRTEVEKLAQQAVEDPNLLKQHLSWLLTVDFSSAWNGQIFGYELGKADQDRKLLPLLVEKQAVTAERATPYLLGGYFAALFEKDVERWERELDALAEDSVMKSWVPELTVRSGMSERAALRVLTLLRDGNLDGRLLRAFGYWKGLSALSEKDFQELIALLLNDEDVQAASVALNLYHSYYRVDDAEGERHLPEEQTLILLKRSLSLAWGKPMNVRASDNADSYYWSELAKRYLQFYSEHTIEIAEVMLASLGEDDGISSIHSRPIEVLTHVLRTRPVEVWSVISGYLGKPYDTKAFLIKEWLNGGITWSDEPAGGLLDYVPADRLWEWVDANIEERAWVLATLVPKRLFREEGKVCLAREILVKYGQREDVRHNLEASFISGGWTGPASLHWARKRERLLEFRAGENNMHVRQWIDEFVSHLDARIEEARIREEWERLA